MSSAPDDALCTRFRADLAALVGENALKQSRFGVALSGGPDSLALLLLAHAVMGPRIEAATVDHGLRTEAADEAAWCAALCHDLTIPHATLRPSQPITGNIQAEARRVRYALLNGWAGGCGIDWILTAHHADDQAETFLMRLNRGAGVGGLAGVRARNAAILRPLLAWRRSELQDIVTAAGYTALDDPSNANPDFDRVRLRQALAANPWLNVGAITRSASHLGDAEAALAWATDGLLAEHVRLDMARQIVYVATPLQDLPRELALRLIKQALALADPLLTPRGEALERVLVQMRARTPAMIGNLMITANKANEGWTITAAPQRHHAPDKDQR